MIAEVNIYLIVVHAERGRVVHGIKAEGNMYGVRFDTLPEVADIIDLGGLECGVVTTYSDLPDYPMVHLLLDFVVRDSMLMYSEVITHLLDMGMRVEEI